MTNLAYKELMSIRWITEIAAERERELNEFRDKISRIKGLGSGMEKVQCSQMSDRVSEDVIRLCELEERFVREVRELNETIERVSNNLKKLSKDEYYTVLYKRFIRFKEIHVIAREMHYSERWVYQLIKMALAEYEERFCNGY